jgi:outer membrane protein assembly factor BamA
MDSATIYRVIQGYLRRLPSAMKKERLKDGAEVEYCAYTPHSLGRRRRLHCSTPAWTSRGRRNFLGHRHIMTTQIYDKRRIAASQSASHDVPMTRSLSRAAFFDVGSGFNTGGLKEQRFIRPAQTIPPVPTTFLITAVWPLGDIDRQLPKYHISLGFELRVMVPVVRIPLRFIFAYNPNVQISPPPATLLAPEKRFAFRIGFGRTL